MAKLGQLPTKEYNNYMNNEQARRRLVVVNTEIDMYFNSKTDESHQQTDVKIYSPKNFDLLISEQIKLKKQLNII